VVATQWRFAGQQARVVALDYAAVEAGARMAAIEVTPVLFRKLRILEAAAVRVMGEARRR
jgi:hypothetical protein